MADLLELISGRRSIRTYLDKEISGNMVESILKAAMSAPSACAKDPWRFIVVQDKALLKKLSEGLPNAQMLPSANVGIVVCGVPAVAHDGQLSYMLQDCSAAIENMLLAVHALKLGACWLGVHPRQERIDHVRRVCEIPDSVIPVSVISIGHPAEKKPARSRYVNSYIHNEKW